MKVRITSLLLTAAIVAAPTALLVGCDKEISHDKVTQTNSNGTGRSSETTVKEKPNGAVETTTEKKVDNNPGR